MSSVIVSCNHNSGTAKKLAKKLEIKHVELTGRERLKKTFTTLIRWGTNARAFKASRTYNKAKAIALCSDKLRTRQVLARNNIPIPHMGTDKFPCVGRPRHHQAGKNFWVCYNKLDVLRARLRGAKYFSQLYPKTAEYRVHIAHGKALITSKKVCIKTESVAWNYALSNAKFEVMKWDDWPAHIVYLAIRAGKATGIDFGAVDIMADPERKGFPRAVVLEINTAPKLADYGIERYTEYFNWLINSNRRQKHKGYKTQHNFVFKHYQLRQY